MNASIAVKYFLLYDSEEGINLMELVGFYLKIRGNKILSCPHNKRIIESAWYVDGQGNEYEMKHNICKDCGVVLFSQQGKVPIRWN